MKKTKQRKQKGLIFNYAWVYSPKGKKHKAYVPNGSRWWIYLLEGIFLAIAIISLILGSWASFGTFLVALVGGPIAFFLTDVGGISQTQTLNYLKEGCFPVTPKDARILIDGLKVSKCEDKIQQEWVELAKMNDANYQEMINDKKNNQTTINHNK